MSNDDSFNHAWNKVEQTHDFFKKTIAPLKQHLGIDFGYMIAFNDGRYFQIIENLECLHKWVTNVKTSHIFCARNVTTYFDEPYNFTIWPEKPTCTAMEIYKEYGMWNGITVSRPNKDYTELYWFTKQNAEDGWHKWFIRNKSLIVKCIKYFKNHTNIYNLNENISQQELFRFIQGLDIQVLSSEYVIKKESSSICKLNLILDSNPRLTEHLLNKIHLSPREAEVLSIAGRGYTHKFVADKLNLSPKTAQNYIESIKQKMGLRNKTELMQLYETFFL